MKQFGQLFCTLAILTQIILSSGWVKVHQADCQSSQPSQVDSQASPTNNAQLVSHTQGCNCGHHHAVQPIEKDQPLAPTLDASTPNSPCTCQTSSPENYVQQLNIVDSNSSAKQYIAHTKQHLVMPTAQALALTLPSNPPPPDTQRHTSGSYMATHVGIYLL